MLGHPLLFTTLHRYPETAENIFNLPQGHRFVQSDSHLAGTYQTKIVTFTRGSLNKLSSLFPKLYGKGVEKPTAREVET